MVDPRAARRAAGAPATAPCRCAPPTSPAPSPVNVTRPAEQWLANADLLLARDERRLLLEIPMGFTDMQREAPELALEWRMQTREIFEAYFPAATASVDFFLDRPQHRGRYLLARANADAEPADPPPKRNGAAEAPS